MVKYTFVLLTLILVSCSDGGAKLTTNNNGEAPGLVGQPYNDGSDLSAVQNRDASGNLSESGTLKGGKREGAWTEYYSNGIVKTVTSYVNGLKEGAKVELGTTGQLERKMDYHLDQLHGEYKEFKYSTLREERYYQNGKLEGTTKIYYDNGKIMEEGAYKNGTRDGLSKWYDQEGNVTIEYEYKNGQLVKK